MGFGLPMPRSGGTIQIENFSLPASRPNPAMSSTPTTKASSGPSSSPSAAGKSGSSRRGQQAGKNVPVISGAEFDRRAEAGEDLSEYIDYERPISDAQFARQLAASKKTG
jgi:hypothetical protein